jgi:hypothetical protein
MTASEFLKTYPQNLQEIAESLRDVVRSTFPAAIEKVNTGWKLIGYRIPYENKTIYFCCVAPQKKENDVLLGFEYGVAMRDPKKLMEGKGTQVRFVRLKRLEQYAEADLTWLIEEAARIAIQFRSGRPSGPK